jgi:hypothetical protein
VLPSDVGSAVEEQVVLGEPDDDPVEPALDTGDTPILYCTDVAYQLI